MSVRRTVIVTAAAALVSIASLVGALPAQAAQCPTVGSDGTVSPPASPRVNWAGCELSGANLSGANLRGANLNGANLLNANLSGANLRKANLFNSNLSPGNLSNANLSGANLQFMALTGANLSGANLTGAFLTRATLDGANLDGVTLPTAVLACGRRPSQVLGAQITGTPRTLPSGWALTSGRLTAPTTVCPAGTRYGPLTPAVPWP